MCNNIYNDKCHMTCSFLQFPLIDETLVMDGITMTTTVTKFNIVEDMWQNIKQGQCHMFIINEMYFQNMGRHNYNNKSHMIQYLWGNDLSDKIDNNKLNIYLILVSNKIFYNMNTELFELTICFFCEKKLREIIQTNT